MLVVEGLSKTFYSGFLRRTANQVLLDVSFRIKRGETLGLKGDSGCGKTTLARCILRLIPSNAGAVFLDGASVLDARGRALSRLRRKMQMIFQHPYSALDPRKTLKDSLLEGMIIHGMHDPETREERVMDLLGRTELHPEVLQRYPHEVSGGQLQRVVIARALSLEPTFLILDEPTSMLDISVQASILQLLKKLQTEMSLSYLFISHDSDVVDFMSHRISGMEKGRLL